MGRPNVNWNVGNIVDKHSIYTSKTVKAGIPFASQIIEPDTKYIIKYDFDLKGDTVEMPNNCTLEFDGGNLFNGTIVGNHTDIVADNVTIFKDVVISGIWDVRDIYDIWFDYVFQEGVAKNQVIHNILGLTNDNCKSTIHFVTEREYLVELPKININDIDPDWRTNPISENGSRRNVVHWMYYQNYPDTSIPSADVPRLKYDWMQMNPFKDLLSIFRISSNTDIVLGSTIRMLPTAQSAYYLFCVENDENVSISGNGTIIGDNYGAEQNSDGVHYGRHLYNYTGYEDGKYVNYAIGNGSYCGEWGHIIYIRGCRNILITGVTLKGAFGDSIIVEPKLTSDETVPLDAGADDGSWLDTPVESKGVTINNVNIVNARRNGISVAAEDVIITNCRFEGNGIDEITGTPPMAAIDFECDGLNESLSRRTYPTIGNKNVIMSDCTFNNNKSDVSGSTPCPKWADDAKTIPYTGAGVTVQNCNLGWLRLNVVNNMTFINCEVDTIESAAGTIGAWYQSQALFSRCHLKNVRDTFITSRYNVGYAFDNCTFDNAGSRTFVGNFKITYNPGTYLVVRVTKTRLRQHVVKIKGWIQWEEDHTKYAYVEGVLSLINRGKPWAFVSLRPSLDNRNDSEYYRMDVIPLREKEDDDFKWILIPHVSAFTGNAIRFYMTAECTKSGMWYDGDQEDGRGYDVTFDYDSTMPQQKVKNNLLENNPGATAEEINAAIVAEYETFLTNNVDDTTKDIIYKQVNISSYSIVYEDVTVPAEAGNIMLVGTKKTYGSGTSLFEDSLLYLTGNAKKYTIPLNIQINGNQLTAYESNGWDVQNRLAFMNNYGPVFLYGGRAYNADGSRYAKCKVCRSVNDLNAFANYEGMLIIADEINLSETITLSSRKIGFSGSGRIKGGILEFKYGVRFEEGWQSRLNCNITTTGNGKVFNYGPSANRPTNVEGGTLENYINIGTCYFDTTLGKPIWYNGTAWVDATGATV